MDLRGRSLLTVTDFSKPEFTGQDPVPRPGAANPATRPGAGRSCIHD